MISLLEILKEAVTSTPKIVIMAGGAGSGKSYTVSNFLGKQEGAEFTPNGSSEKWVYVNPDVWLDNDSPLYDKNASLGSAQGDATKTFKSAVENNQNILWDTTGTNLKTTMKKIPENYNPYMVMVYTHPMQSILKNASRARKVPLDAVVKTWNQAYSNIAEYKKAFGDKFILVQNIDPRYEDEIEEFNNAVEGGGESLKQYLTDLVSQGGDKFKTTFSKDFNFSSKEIEQAFNSALSTSQSKGENDKTLKDAKKEFEKVYNKKGTFPDSSWIDNKVSRTKANKEKRNTAYTDNIDGVVNKLTTPEFQEVLDFTSTEELSNKFQNFIK